MKVTVNQSSPVNVSVRGSQTTLNATVDATGPQGPKGDPGSTGPAGANGLSLLSAATDVDVTNITDGALLIFNEGNGKWTAGTMLESQYIEGGHF
jgi:hypothetical protein